MARRPRILILCNYPHGGAPGQRFRFEQYIPALEEAGFDVTQASFWDPSTLAVLYAPGHTLAKISGTLRGLARRVALLPRVAGYDWVFIHLEATPIGPPLIEAMLFLMKKRVVYDIDDAIFIAKTSAVNRLAAPFRWRSKVAWTARHAHRVSAVNPFVESWAASRARRVTRVPTTIDETYHRRRNERPRDGLPMIGWTGTFSTARFLDLVRPALRELALRHEFVFRVICDVDPQFPDLPHYEFVRWRRETEIEDLERLDIGLMPVMDEEFSKGKVGFKAIQYGALEIPAVVSDVGSGAEVVADGITGYVVPNQTAAWVERLDTLLSSAELRAQMGRAARPHVLSTYSVTAQTPRYVALFSDDDV
jgi:glycosyltransferase involved in cell wall biosynthesis